MRDFGGDKQNELVRGLASQTAAAVIKAVRGSTKDNEAAARFAVTIMFEAILELSEEHGFIEDMLKEMAGFTATGFIKQ